MKKFRKLLNERVVLFDGATGTILQQRGLEPGTPPEKALLDDFDQVADIHAEYAEAGAEIMTTISFGANPVKVKEFGLGKHFEEINRRAVRAAKQGTQGALIAADIGPTGLFIEPVGELSWDDAVKTYGAQARIFVDEGVDLFIIETMSDIRELKAAVVAIRSVCDLPIIGMMTFDDSGRSTLGSPPEVAAVVLDALGVDVVGSNCSVGPDGILRWLQAMRRVSSSPLIAMPNAGVPKLDKGKTVFPLGPDELAGWVEKFLDLGCGVIGSCCGSTPAHTKALANEMDRLGRKYRKPDRRLLYDATSLASRTEVIFVGPGQPIASVGERINPTGRSEFTAELKGGDLNSVKKEARLQESNGVDLIDINVGVPGLNEAELLRDAVFAAESVSNVPIVLDSADPEAVESALTACAGKPLINSVNGDRKSLKSVLPLAKKYGAAVLGLCTDEKGVPATADERIKIARRIIKAAAKAGIPGQDVLLDPVTVPVSADPVQAAEALKSIRYFSEKLHRGTLQGVSNISFGLPRRGTLNATYMVMAFEAGLNATFVNPLDEKAMEIFYASKVLMNQDVAANDYITYCRHISGDDGKAVPSKKAQAAKTWDASLRTAITDGDERNVVRIVKAALAEGISPMVISDLAMVPGIREVGHLFESGEIYLPNLMLSAKAMEAGVELVNHAIEESAGTVKTKGAVIIATVEGDIHDIGKNIVVTVLRTNGWRVLDLGRGVPAKKILQEAERENADLVGLSALMTTTVVKMPEAIELLHGKGIPVMVGGAVLTEEYASEIGADFYGKDAIAALRGAEKLKKTKK